MTSEQFQKAEDLLQEIYTLQKNIDDLRAMVLSEQDSVHITIGQSPHFYQTDLHGVTALKFLQHIREDAEERVRGLREKFAAL